jgi:hypothetical protein
MTYTGPERRCTHQGSSCIHRRRFQAYYVEPETWRTHVRRNWPEIVFGTIVLLILFGALAYGPALLVGR